MRLHSPLLALAALLCSAAAPTRPLTPEEQAGKRIYYSGESPAGSEITAMVGPEAILPGSALPCVNCHGDDGLGRPEGGVLPSEVIWSQLAKPYGHKHPSGRKHPKFDEQNLARAITSGVDPAGNKLDAAMPRYTMARQDMDSLIAYLKRLEFDLPPGLTDTTMRVGTVLPTKGPLGEMSQALKRTLEAYFAELNEQGGVHGRRVELVVLPYDGSGDLGPLRRQLTDAPVFALLSGLAPGVEKDLLKLADEQGLPFIGPLTSTTPGSDSASRYVFFVLAGVREQAGVLVEYATRSLKLPARTGVILHPDEPTLGAAATDARERFAARGWKKVSAVSYPPGKLEPALAERLKKQGAGFVLFLGNDADLTTLMSAAEAAAWKPHLLVPGSLAARAALDAPAHFEKRVFLAYPALASEAQPRALEAFGRVVARAQVDMRHSLALVSAYTSARLLTEGLRRSGKALNRTRLVGELEKLYLFETGLVPPLSYGPTRRVGAAGSYVVTVDVAKKSFVPVTRWLALTDS